MTALITILALFVCVPILFGFVCRPPGRPHD
jgi:hypothetical protein